MWHCETSTHIIYFCRCWPISYTPILESTANLQVGRWGTNSNTSFAKQLASPHVVTRKSGIKSFAAPCALQSNCIHSPWTGVMNSRPSLCLWFLTFVCLWAVFSWVELRCMKCKDKSWSKFWEIYYNITLSSRFHYLFIVHSFIVRICLFCVIVEGRPLRAKS